MIGSGISPFSWRTLNIFEDPRLVHTPFEKSINFSLVFFCKGALIPNIFNNKMK